MPFVSIPVKKTMDNIWGLGPVSAIANINVGAVVLAGAMVFGTAVVLPFISTFFKKQLVLGNKRERGKKISIYQNFYFLMCICFLAGQLTVQAINSNKKHDTTSNPSESLLRTRELEKIIKILRL